MKLYNVRLTDDEREALEVHRIRLGLRSHAETIRYLTGSGEQPLVASVNVEIAAIRAAIDQGIRPPGKRFSITPPAPYGVDAITGEPLPKPSPVQKGGKK